MFSGDGELDALFSAMAKGEVVMTFSGDSELELASNCSRFLEKGVAGRERGLGGGSGSTSRDAVGGRSSLRTDVGRCLDGLRLLPEK